MADEPLPPETPPVAEAAPVVPAVPPSGEAPPKTPLDEAPLGEYVARRKGGEHQAEPAAEAAPLEDGSGAERGAKGKGNFKNRFDQVYRQRSDAIRAFEAEKARAEQLETELRRYKQPTAPAEPAAPVAAIPQRADVPPELDAYLAAGKTYEDWLDARNDWRIERRLVQERQRVQQEIQAQQFQQQVSGFGERSEAALTKYPDYQQVVVGNDRVFLSPVMQDIALRSPYGPDIMYWLGTHETEANQLGALTASYPQEAFPLVEQHLLLLSGHRSDNGGAKKAVSVSQAPAPISPLGGGSTTSAVALDSLSLGDFIKRRNADQKKRTG